MKYKYSSLGKRMLVLGTALFALSSCEDILDQRPPISIDSENVFNNPERVASAVNGIYALTKAGNWYGGRLLVYHDLRASDLRVETDNQVLNTNVYAYSVDAGRTEINTAWAAAYAAIQQSNAVLTGLDNNPGVVSDALAKQYRGEAQFLRALNYFNLVHLYGARPYPFDNGAGLGVILRIRDELNTDNITQPRATVGEIFDQIIEDLVNAENNLPTTRRTGSSPVTANRLAVQALKTRVFLYMAGPDGDMNGEDFYFDSVANVYNRMTVPTLATNYSSLFGPGVAEPEAIFYFGMTSNTGDFPGIQSGVFDYVSRNGAYSLKLADSTGIWPVTDTRRNMIISGTGAFASRFFSLKFSRPDKTDFVPVLRAAEVRLNYAEAIARNNPAAATDASALAAFNLVRQRAGNPALTTADVPTNGDLVAAIMLERRLEFFTEGHGSIDYMRLLQPLPTKPLLGGATFSGTVPISNQQYVWPIPVNETTQNPVPNNPDY